MSACKHNFILTDYYFKNNSIIILFFLSYRKSMTRMMCMMNAPRLVIAPMVTSLSQLLQTSKTYASISGRPVLFLFSLLLPGRQQTRLSGNELHPERLLFQESKGVEKQNANAGAGFVTFTLARKSTRKKCIQPAIYQG